MRLANSILILKIFCFSPHFYDYLGVYDSSIIISNARNFTYAIK